jgi:hypothetical protein
VSPSRSATSSASANVTGAWDSLRPRYLLRFATVAISDRTRKLLWGRAANRCAICRALLSAEARHSDDRHAIIGTECHIVARRPGGPQAGEIDEAELDSYDNLVLLCAGHHKQVDDQPHEYTSSKLRGIKRAHEQWVESSLERVQPSPNVRLYYRRGLAVKLSITMRGGEVLDLMARTLAYHFDHAEPLDAAEAELIGDFLQDLADFCDIVSEIGPAAQTREKFRITELISELATHDLFVLIGEVNNTLEVNAEREPFPTAVVKLVRGSEVLVEARKVEGSQGDHPPSATPAT